MLTQKYRILHGKCVRTVFTHELWRIRNRTSEQIPCGDNSRSSFFSPLKKSFKSFTSRLVFPCVFLFSRLSTYSSTEESWITKRFSLMAFAKTGTFNINDGRNANKNYLLSSDLQSDGLCGVRNRANLPYGSHVKKHDTRLLIGRIFSHVGKAIRDI